MLDLTNSSKGKKRIRVLAVLKPEFIMETCIKSLFILRKPKSQQTSLALIEVASFFYFS